MSTTTIDGAAVLITGANRGLGRALVAEALDRGAARVYAAARHPATHPDPRVTPLVLDVTDPPQIRRAAAAVDALDVLVNNAGVSVPDDLGDRRALTDHLAVNLFGTADVTQAFVPALTRSRGSVVNIVSLSAVAAVPVPKSAPESVARGVFDGVERGEPDIFPDPCSATFADRWRAGVGTELERQNAALVSASGRSTT